MSESEERWLPVVGFEGRYEVSDQGRVRSLDQIVSYAGRYGPATKKVKGRVLRPGTVTAGYQLVVLGRGNPKLIHALVLESFVGPRPAGHDGCHADGNPANNSLGNLRWDTRSANIADAKRHGTFRNAVQEGLRPRAKVRREDVPAIRRRLASGEGDQAIADEFGCPKSSVALIRRGRTWRDVPQEDL